MQAERWFKPTARKSWETPKKCRTCSVTRGLRENTDSLALWGKHWNKNMGFKEKRQTSICNLESFFKIKKILVKSSAKWEQKILLSANFTYRPFFQTESIEVEERGFMSKILTGMMFCNLYAGTVKNKSYTLCSCNGRCEIQQKSGKNDAPLITPNDTHVRLEIVKYLSKYNYL